MKQRPILFSTEMIQSILAGNKTQTRRLVKPPYNTYPAVTKYLTSCEFDFHFPDGIGQYTISPYGIPCDQLWVRETFVWEGETKYTDILPIGDFYYKADFPAGDGPTKWKPSIFMPREASRITLEITDIQVERLLDISEEDAIHEGVGSGFQINAGYPDYQHIENGICQLTQDTAKMSFASLWEKINGPGSWEKNLWCWVVSFKRIE